MTITRDPRQADNRFVAILKTLTARWMAATDARDHDKATRIKHRYSRLMNERHARTNPNR